MTFIQIFIENFKSRFIKREKPYFKQRHRLCYTNWMYEQYNRRND